jgi:uncharacterized protein
MWQRIPISAIRIDRPASESLVFLVYGLGYVAFAIAIASLIRFHPLPILGASQFVDDASYVFLFKICGMLVVPLVIARRLGYRLRDLVVAWPTFGPVSVVQAALAFSCGALLNVGRLAAIRSVVGEHSVTWAAPRIIVGAVLPLVIAAIPEELAYRAILQTRLEAWIGRAPAIVIATVLFVAWHIPSRFLLADGVEGRAGNLGSVMLGTGVPVAIVGFVFAVLWDRYRRLDILIAAHWGIDVLPSVSSLVGIRF